MRQAVREAGTEAAACRQAEAGRQRQEGRGIQVEACMERQAGRQRLGPASHTGRHRHREAGTDSQR
jgi:hypothetical protein